MKKRKFTFKRHPRITGLAGIGYTKQSVDIKLDKHIVGIIYAPNWQSVGYTWDVGFTVLKDPTQPVESCKWRWIYIKKKYNSEEEARQGAQSLIEPLIRDYTLWSIEDDCIVY